ncbi:MAG TPA: tyrosine-type recombinase/integrase [Microthrixaceae bacterium]|mgnify:FL=1|nr:tyrosine-type recombinase/integrase [Microthrixaceae bacterium]
MGSRVCVVVPGPLAVVADRFGEALAELGYTPLSAANQVQLLANLSRWMSSESLSLSELTEAELERFLAFRRAAGYTRRLSRRGLRPLVAVLRDGGLIPGPSAPELSEVDVLLGEFAEFLRTERGLAEATIGSQVRGARRFLEVVMVEGAPLTAATVVSYVGTACVGRAVGTAKLELTALRSVLRFLHVTGRVGVDLSAAVLGAAGWRDAGVPKGLTETELEALLVAVDVERPTRRRDRAVVLLLVRLGLRRGEVVGLGLDDIDWRAGELTIAGKGRRVERLPLPVDVGEALVDYLAHERLAGTDERAVFVRSRAPRGPLAPEAVTAVVGRLAAQAGLGTVGAHRLRHTAATSMLRAGADLVEIGQVLRHRNVSSTAIYAKVDLDRLRRLARPWPRPLVGEDERVHRQRLLAPPWPRSVQLAEVTS